MDNNTWISSPKRDEVAIHNGFCKQVKDYKGLLNWLDPLIFMFDAAKVNWKDFIMNS